MDGSNRTEVVDILYTPHHRILSLTLDYQAQVIYWVGYDNNDDSTRVNSSNVDGTNGQTILQFPTDYRYHYYYNTYQHGLSLFEDTFFLSKPLNSEVNKFIIGENLTTISNGMHCSSYYGRLKIVSEQHQQSGDNHTPIQ